jgi:ubiquinone/menaquinone biosynthesis C-methylase UbiE
MIHAIKKTLFVLQIKWIEILSFMVFRFPALRRRFWTKQYNKNAEMLNDDYIFMNLGYASLEADEKPPEELSQIDRFSEKLYQHVIGETNLQGKDVLEVGCGRGGGSLYIMRQFHPKRLTAVDIAQRAIERCKAVHNKSGIHFQQADAMFLPFPKESFDAVINIESSHCYPSRKRFFMEVARVLRPGGFFLYADLISFLADNLTVGHVHTLLNNSGLTIIRAQDITKNVLKSRDLLTQSGLFEEAMYTWLHDEFKPYSSVIIPITKNGYYLKGTVPYRCLQTGMIAYWSWILQKPE